MATNHFSTPSSKCAPVRMALRDCGMLVLLFRKSFAMWSKNFHCSVYFRKQTKVAKALLPFTKKVCLAFLFFVARKCKFFSPPMPSRQGNALFRNTLRCVVNTLLEDLHKI